MRRVFAIVRKIEEWLLASAMICLAVLTIANVISRNAFNESLAFAEELSQFLIILVCFVGLSYGASMGRHIRMTALYDQLPEKVRKVFMVFIAGTTSLLLFFLAFLALRYAWGVDARSPVLHVPVYLVYLFAPIGLTLGGIQYALTVVRNLTSKGVYLSYDLKDEYEEPASGGI